MSYETTLLFSLSSLLTEHNNEVSGCSRRTSKVSQLSWLCSWRTIFDFKMAIVNTNWKAFLSSDSDLHPDVFFLVGSEDENIERGDNTGKIIPAHKFLLAGVSPVFRKQFFGSMKEEEDDIKWSTPQLKLFRTWSTTSTWVLRTGGAKSTLVIDLDIGPAARKNYASCSNLVRGTRFWTWKLRSTVPSKSSGSHGKTWYSQQLLQRTIRQCVWWCVWDVVHKVLELLPRHENQCWWHIFVFHRGHHRKLPWSFDILLELKKVKEERILRPGDTYQMYADALEKCNQQ